MQVQLKEIGNHPVFAYRKYDILRDGLKVGTFGKNRDGRWDAQIIRNRSEPYTDFNRTSFAYSNYQAMVRLIACYLQGDDTRVEQLRRGIWVNPCPQAEIVA